MSIYNDDLEQIIAMPSNRFLLLIDEIPTIKWVSKDEGETDKSWLKKLESKNDFINFFGLQ